ncbi:tetratricopeptide repeat protein [Patescibacteria group bacterium]
MTKKAKAKIISSRLIFRHQLKLISLKDARKILWFSLPTLGPALIIFFLCLSLAFPKDRFQLAKERLSNNPQDIEAHLILAEEFLNNNQYQEAEAELMMVQKFKNSENQGSQVLGEKTSLRLERLWQRKNESDPDNLRWLLSQWEQVVAQKPDYRDGYLYLALLNYQLNQIDQANEYLKIALELDPNYEPTKKMMELLSS